MVTDNQVSRFSALFKGYSLAYGTYVIGKAVAPEPGEKNLGKGKTVTGPITPKVWSSHLNGTGPGLGVIMLQDNDTCRFAVIDVDDYLIDHSVLCAKVDQLNLPLVVCRTKSGGAHLYVFLKE